MATWSQHPFLLEKAVLTKLKLLDYRLVKFPLACIVQKWPLTSLQLEAGKEGENGKSEIRQPIHMLENVVV